MTIPESRPAAADPTLEALVAEAVALRRSGRLDASKQLFEQAIALDATHPGVLTSYAALLLETGDTQGAIRLGREAVLADPGRMSAHHVLGQSLCRAGHLAEGIRTLRHAVALREDAFEVHVHLGNALIEVHDLAEAERHLNRARELAPQVAAIHVGLGNLYRSQQRPGAALGAYRRAIELDAGVSQAYNNLGNLLSEVGDAEGAVSAFRRALALAPDRASTWSNFLLALNRSDRVGTAELAAEHRAFGLHFGERILPLEPVALRPPTGRRLKVGYVSSDFVSHAVVLFAEPLLAHHDRQRFDIYCFHASKSSDETTERIRALSEHFVPIAGLPDEDVARRIRAEAIDILVDLNGHTSQNRLLLFLLKPAPIQVTWLGYLGTTGISTVDYRLTDAQADPPGLTEALHTESLWRLPDSLFCYQPYDFAPEVGALPAQRNGHVTFACLNNPAKVSWTIGELWGRILAQLPGSRLLLMSSSLVERTEALGRLLAGHGVATERVEHVPKQSTADYLALYNRADIALDTWPYAGGATTCDALWMGVPVVTLAGERSFSRSGASVLFSAGLPELIAEEPDGYVDRALALARDVPRLAALRATLRQRLRASPLTDGARFARSVETAYTAMAAAAFEKQPRER